MIDLHPDQFDIGYKARMIAAYPTIAQMTADEMYYANAAEKDEAFTLILRNKNLRRTHEMYLEGDDE